MTLGVNASASRHGNKNRASSNKLEMTRGSKPFANSQIILFLVYAWIADFLFNGKFAKKWQCLNGLACSDVIYWFRICFTAEIKIYVLRKINI